MNFSSWFANSKARVTLLISVTFACAGTTNTGQLASRIKLTVVVPMSAFFDSTGSLGTHHYQAYPQLIRNPYYTD